MNQEHASEGRLPDSEQRLRDYFQLQSIGMAICAADGQWIEVNDKLCEMLGYSREDLLRSGWTALTHPDDLGYNLELLERLRTGKLNGYSLEKRYIHKNGTEVDAHISVRCVFNANGAIDHLFVTHQDITERKRTERALRESEERFRNLIEGSIEGILIERYRRPLFANQAFADILGYTSPADILALDSIEGHVAPHERERLQRYAEARFAKHPTPTTYEYDAVRRDGSIVTLQNVARLVTWHGEPAVQNTVIDISERKRATAALEAVTDAVPAIINAKDKRSRYIFMNHYQAKLYGVAPEDAVGKTAGEFLGNEYGTYTEQLDRKVLETGEAIPYFEEHYVDAHGVSHTFLTTKVPLREANGQVESVATISLDITARKQAERALRDSEERYRALYEHNPSMYFTVASDGTVLSVNPFGAQQVGYTREELIGTSIFNLFHTQDRETLGKSLDHVLARPGELKRCELRQVHKAGNLLWVRKTARAIDDAEGQRVILIVCEDITATLQLSEELSYQASHDALTEIGRAHV